MPKKQGFHGDAADPDWWRTALRRHKQGKVFPNHLTTEGFAALIAAYLDGEIPAAIFGVSFLRAFNEREAASERLENALWGVKALADRLPGFDPMDDVYEWPEAMIKQELAPLLSELQRVDSA